MKVMGRFPRNGLTQACFGVENGQWHTWMIHGAVNGRRHPHCDRIAALQAHETNIETVALKMRSEKWIT